MTPPRRRQRLIAALLAEYDAVAGRHLTGGLPTPDDLPPAGTYLVGFAEDGEAVAAGASRRCLRVIAPAGAGPFSGARAPGMPVQALPHSGRR